MKMRPEHFEKLKESIEKVLTENPNAREEYKKAGLSDMRFRWDVFKSTKYNILPLYTYLTDDHIDTALRKIIK